MEDSYNGVASYTTFQISHGVRKEVHLQMREARPLKPTLSFHFEGFVCKGSSMSCDGVNILFVQSAS